MHRSPLASSPARLSTWRDSHLLRRTRPPDDTRRRALQPRERAPHRCRQNTTHSKHISCGDLHRFSKFRTIDETHDTPGYRAQTTPSRVQIRPSPEAPRNTAHTSSECGVAWSFQIFLLFHMFPSYPQREVVSDVRMHRCCCADERRSQESSAARARQETHSRCPGCAGLPAVRLRMSQPPTYFAAADPTSSEPQPLPRHHSAHSGEISNCLVLNANALRACCLLSQETADSESAPPIQHFSPPCTRSSGRRPGERAKRVCAGAGHHVWTGRREKTAHPSIAITNGSRCISNNTPMNVLSFMSSPIKRPVISRRIP